MQAYRAHGFSARRAFTLIELLVVISIIGLMTGLIVAGAMKFKDAARDNAADAQVSRLQTKLRADYGQVVQKCNQEGAPPAILAYCGGDRDRALAVHTAATIRTYFPETFAEATASFDVGGVIYRPKSTFASVATVTGATPVSTATSPNANDQRAVLLHLILSERAVGGGTGDESGAAGETRVVKFGGKDFTVFVDSYGTPLIYYRWAQNAAELDVAPYTPPSAGGSKDPLDPKGLVAGWTDPTLPSPANTAKRDYLRSKSPTGTEDGTRPDLVFNSSNRVPTIVSAGRNKTFEALGAVSDDRVGYRLDRFGNKGDKK